MSECKTCGGKGYKERAYRECMDYADGGDGWRWELRTIKVRCRDCDGTGRAPAYAKASADRPAEERKDDKSRL